MSENLVNYLSNFVTDRRIALFRKIAQERTKYITVVLENLYQPQNASAVLRTCDCLGVQDVHIIENDNEYKINPDVELGSAQWLKLHRFRRDENNTLECIANLKKQGYRIVATTPHTNDVNIQDFDISKGKFALLFGEEQPGLSKIAMEQADEFVKIPMFGFTESFNISVSAAICLHQLTLKLRNSDINWKLSDSENNELLLNWLRNTIKAVDLIEKDYHEKLLKQC